MTIKCELSNYANNKSPIDNPKVIVEDDGPISDHVRISIGDSFAVVSISQLEKALQACAIINRITW